jgi:hypothetical protein
MRLATAASQDFANQLSSMDTRQKSSDTAALSSPVDSVANERHYSVEEVGKMWTLGNDTVRRMFRNIPGVLVLRVDNHRIGKRRYETLRIPQSVLERVHAQYSFGNYVPIS